jgi:hypothetical protein
MKSAANVTWIRLWMQLRRDLLPSLRPFGFRDRAVRGLVTRGDFRSYNVKLVDSEKRSLSRSDGATPTFAHVRDDYYSVAQFEFLLGFRARLRRKIVIQPFNVIRLRPRAVVAINP